MLSQFSDQRIAIIGTGALASLFAARLSQVATTFMIGTWQAQIDAINQAGITVAGQDKQQEIYQVLALHAGHLPHDLPPADVAIVLVKSYQTARAAERISAVLKPSGIVLSLQNGLGNKEILESALPDHHISCGITMQGGNIPALATVNHAGNGAAVIDDQPFLEPVIEMLKTAGLPVLTPAEYGSKSIDEAIWGKLIINAAINPLTALLGQPNGFLADDPTAERLCRATAREAAGVAVLEGAWAKEKLDEAEESAVHVARLTAPNRSSMLQDVSRGGRTEIESICGEIVKRGKQHGVETPINQIWLELIQAVEKIEGGTAGEQVYSAGELKRFLK